MDFEAWRDDVVCQEEVRMISVEDWAEIRRLHFAEELGIKTIAKRLGIARNTVRAAVRSSEPPSYEREGPGSRVDGVEDEIRALLGEFPEMPATVIAERIGWPYGITVLRDRVRELRPLFVAPDPAQRTVYRPGELACGGVRVEGGKDSMMKTRRVLGLVVFLVLLVPACDAPDPEVHQLVAGTWGSPVRPTVGDIAYGPERGCPSGSDELCGGSQELDIYRVRAGGNRGTLVYIHGGGYVTGDKYPLGNIGNTERQLHRGYSIVSINHRLPPIERDVDGNPILVRAGPIGWPFPQSLGENGFPEAMADVAAALNWVYTRGPAYRLSTGTVVVMGFSAGGTMAALAGMAANTSDPLFSTLPTVDGWVAVSAPLDWDSFADGARWGALWMGDQFASDRHRSNPITHFDPADPPAISYSESTTGSSRWRMCWRSTSTPGPWARTGTSG